MNCLRYWARYMRKGEVKDGGIKTFFGLLYLKGDKSEKVYTGYKV